MKHSEMSLHNSWRHIFHATAGGTFFMYDLGSAAGNLQALTQLKVVCHILHPGIAIQGRLQVGIFPKLRKQAGKEPCIRGPHGRGG